jgi:hypothetical protein
LQKNGSRVHKPAHPESQVQPEEGDLVDPAAKRLQEGLAGKQQQQAERGRADREEPQKGNSKRKTVRSLAR